MKRNALVMSNAFLGIVFALITVSAQLAWANDVEEDGQLPESDEREGNHAIVEVECGGFFEYPQLTAWDNCEGDLTDQIVIGGDIVNPYVVGEYLVTYNVTNSAGMEAKEATRTIQVYDDTPPEITLFGENPVKILVGAPYEDEGATAFDACDGDLTYLMTLDSTVDTNIVGDYVVTYSVEDYSANVAEKTRYIYVREDLGEDIHLKNITLMEGDTYGWHGAIENKALATSFQWYRYNGYDYDIVEDGAYGDGAYFGAKTDTLFFAPFTADMAAEYMLEVSDDTTTTQKTATVTLEEKAELPATSLFGLATAVAALVAAGAIVMKRRHG